MKKLMSILGIVAFSVAIFFNAQVFSSDSSIEDGIDLSSILEINQANAEASGTHNYFCFDYKGGATIPFWRRRCSGCEVHWNTSNARNICQKD